MYVQMDMSDAPREKRINVHDLLSPINQFTPDLLSMVAT